MAANGFWLSDRVGVIGPWLADGVMKTAEWINKDGVTYRFTSCHIGIGVDLGGIMDVWVFITKIPDGEPFAWFWWDHYGDPNGPHMVNKYFTPPFDLAPEEGLRFEYFAAKNLKKPKNAHIMVEVRCDHKINFAKMKGYDPSAITMAQRMGLKQKNGN